MLRSLRVLGAGLALAAVVSAQPEEDAAVAVLRSSDGPAAHGEVWLRPTQGGLALAVELRGLPPSVEFTLRLHARGDLGPADGSGLGAIPKQGGDLGTYVADAQGGARGLRELKGLSLADVLGRGISLSDGRRKVAFGVVGLGSDRVAPTLELVGEPELAADRARLALQASDDRLLAEVLAGAISATRSAQGRYLLEVPSRPGKNRVSVLARDGAGNVRELGVTWELDATAPTIQVLAPKQGAQLNANPVNVVAEVTDPNLASVTIGGQPATQDAKGRWRLALKARDGVNQVAVVGLDRFGNRAQADVSFSFDATPPGVQADAVIVVEGKVDDLSATLTINGQPVRFDPKTGAYAARIKADPQNPNRVTIVATDEYGNRTTEVRTLR